MREVWWKGKEASNFQQTRDRPAKGRERPFSWVVWSVWWLGQWGLVANSRPFFKYTFKYICLDSVLPNYEQVTFRHLCLQVSPAPHVALLTCCNLLWIQVGTSSMCHFVCWNEMQWKPHPSRTNQHPNGQGFCVDHCLAFWCCGPNSTKHQLLWGCPPNNPVDLPVLSHSYRIDMGVVGNTHTLFWFVAVGTFFLIVSVTGYY